MLSCSETRGIRFARESPTAGQEPEAENRGRCDEELESLETKVTRAV